MNERDALRYAARRAALIQSLRAGDPITAGRAASRLRVLGAPMVVSEFTAARDARRRIGRAVIDARRPRAEERPLRHEPAIAGARGSRRRLLAAAATLLAVLLVVFFNTGVPPENGGGAPAAAAVSEPQRAALVTLSRGRTVDAPVELVAVEETPTPAPTATPPPEATATAAPTAGAGIGTRSPAPSGEGSGGSGSGGSGGGSGSGNGSGSGSGTDPSPTPTATPPVPPPGFTRLNIIVLDATTGRPVPGVCVVIGTTNCGPSAPHTDRNGRWSADVAASSASTLWDMYFIKDGYITQFRKITLPGGRTAYYTIRLQRPRGSG
jgi:hypothetical protein